MSKIIYLNPEQLKPELVPLCGHIDQETAHLQPDYPSGRHRVKRRLWVEVRKGHGMRAVAQTTNPKHTGEVWCKPSADTYSRYVCLLHDPANRHVYGYSLQPWADEASVERFQAFWSLFYSRLDEANQRLVDGIGICIAEAAEKNKHQYPEVAVPPTTVPRIEVDVDLVYSPQRGGLKQYVFAHLVKASAGTPRELTSVPVVSAQVCRKGITYNLLSYYSLSKAVIDKAREVVQWHVTDYSQDHWCYAVLKDYRGFEWNGEPINNSVQRLFALKQSMVSGAAPSEADLNATSELAEYIWEAAAEYWQMQRRQAENASVGVRYEISHATCQN